MLQAWLHYWWMFPVGVAIGVIGTLVGAGGGFLLLPLLLLVYRNQEPEVLTSISLAVVFANATAGSVSYARMKRIDYRSGLMFAAAGVPGAVVGAIVNQWIPRRTFDAVFGVTLVVLAVVLVMRARKKEEHGAERGGLATAPLPEPGDEGAVSVKAAKGPTPPPYNVWVGLGISAGVGFLSSILGVGGGIMHVPALTYVLNFPVHVATATSHFVLAITALVGTVVHVVSGSFHAGVNRAVILSLGVVIGAPMGAKLSTRLHGAWIIRGLAVALGMVGVRLVWLAMG